MIRIKNDLIFLLILVSYLFNNILADGENTLIVLPFEKRMDLPFEEEPKKVFMVLKENYLRTEINIGTPSQRLFLRPRIETDYSYIVNEGSYFDSGEPIDLIEYKNKSSSTCSVEESSFNCGSEILEAYFMKDNIKLGNIYIDQMYIIQGLDFYKPNIKYDSGVLGLGRPNTLINSTKSNIILQLKKRDIIKSYKYFIEYTSNDKGNIVIGGEPNDYNPNKYKTKINNFSVIPRKLKELVWGFNITSISFNDLKLDSGASYAEINLSYGIISANRVIKNILHKYYFGELVEKGICYEFTLENNDESYFCQRNNFDKSKLKPLKIFSENMNKEFIIDLSKLFYDHEDKSYFLMSFYYQFDYYIILGEPFIRDNIIVYDQDTKSIGIYIEDEVNNIKKTKLFNWVTCITIIISASIISILLFLLYRYYRRRPRKKRGTELIEDYEYMPQGVKHSEVQLD